MFAFPAIKTLADAKSAFEIERRLINVVSTHILNAALKISDLNFSTLKLILASWSGQVEKVGGLDSKEMPEYLSVAKLKDDIQKLSVYEQQIVKIMLDFQMDILKSVQQQKEVAQLMKTGNEIERSGTQMPIVGADNIALVGNMAEQAGKVYIQWASNALQAMDGLNVRSGHAGDRKHTTRSAKSGNGK